MVEWIFRREQDQEEAMLDTIYSKSGHIPHWTGYGSVLVAAETQADGLAGKLCMVFSNAPRGYQRVYTWEGGKWVGPKIVMAELVELNA